MSDSINGVFPDLRTTDGKTWTDIGDKLPRALAGEGSFASSGTCAATLGDQSAWIATGNTNVARVLVTHDGGDTWDAYPTPLAVGRGAGAFTIAFRDAQNGIVGGGDLDPKHVNVAAAAVSNDGGQNWTLTNRPPVTGAIYGLSYVEGPATAKPKSKLDRTVVITANQGGAAWTPDEGNKWFKLDGSGRLLGSNLRRSAQRLVGGSRRANLEDQLLRKLLATAGWNQGQSVYAMPRGVTADR